MKANLNPLQQSTISRNLYTKVFKNFIRLNEDSKSIVEHNITSYITYCFEVLNFNLFHIAHALVTMDRILRKQSKDFLSNVHRMLEIFIIAVEISYYMNFDKVRGFNELKEVLKAPSLAELEVKYYEILGYEAYVQYEKALPYKKLLENWTASAGL